MKIVLNGCSCRIYKEANDPHFHGVAWAKGESRLLYHLKNILNKHGFNFIKKRMAKDGHMVDELQQYLRVKKPVDNGIYAIYNDYQAICGAEQYLNEDGDTRLRIEWADGTPDDVIEKFHVEITETYPPKAK